MKLFVRVRKWILALSIPVIVFVLTIWVNGQHNRERAQRLIAALQRVRVGTTTLVEIEDLARRHDGRLRQPCDASLCNVDFPIIQNTLMAKAHLAPATRLGGHITVQNGTVSYMTIGFECDFSD